MDTADRPPLRRRRLRAWLPVVVTLAAVAVAGCAPANRGGAARNDLPSPDAAADEARAADEAGVRLVLAIDPRVGDAPLRVQLKATLEGDLDDPGRYRCATVAFALGDDNVQLVPPPVGCTDAVQRIYSTSHTYAAAGNYRATARLIARPVAPSRPAQVLVRGATPTAVPLAANPGPTIIIATPPADDRGASTPPPPSEPAVAATRPATRVVVAPETAARPSVAPATVLAQASTPATGSAGVGEGPSTEPAGRGWLAVLPADLYYLGGTPPRLWRLPASGDEPEALDGPGESTDAFAVSTIGFVARRRGGVITIQSPTGSARTLVEPPADADGSRDDVWGPVWSRDGHQLAYNVNGRLMVFDVVSFAEREVGRSGGAPIGFSRDGKWLLVGLDNGVIGLMDVATGIEQVVPLAEGAGQSAGWLPDRNVLWSAGDGLRFVTVGDPLTVTPVIEPGLATSKVLIRSDQRALVLVQRGEGSALAEIDLTAATVAAEIVGAPLRVQSTDDLSWAPDGRTLAVAGADGLGLIDPATGAWVPLVGGPVSAPAWVIGSRTAASRDGG